MKVTDYERSILFIEAGVCRDKMHSGSAGGRSICILQPVQLANKGINESLPTHISGAPGSYPLSRIHHILKSVECFSATMSLN